MPNTLEKPLQLEDIIERLAREGFISRQQQSTLAIKGKHLGKNDSLASHPIRIIANAKLQSHNQPGIPLSDECHRREVKAHSSPSASPALRWRRWRCSDSHRLQQQSVSQP